MRRWIATAALLVGAAAAAGAAWTWTWLDQLDDRIARTFAEGPWDLPARVYAAPFVFHPGMRLREVGFADRLTRLGYREVSGEPARRGDFRRAGGGIEIFLRGFPYPRQPAPQRRLRLAERDGAIASMVDIDSGEELFAAELEPELLSAVQPASWEQRRVLTLAEVPPRLVHAILTTEDRRFFEHWGIDWRGIARAVAANLTGGRTQGGSTITQQLAKNMFLTAERSLRRKIPEAFLAVLLEQRYSKNQILEGYLNEIYLGQVGPRAIHGVWEASLHYFSRPPGELSLGETALLAGMIRAPNSTSPLKHPQRARERRDIVLQQLAEVGTITPGELAAALAEPIRAAAARGAAVKGRFFVDYVREEAEAKYPDEVLNRAGYDLFTTLDSEMQAAAEAAVAGGLRELEKTYPALARGGELPQAALVALLPQTGAVVAMVGGRSYAASQFNRAVHAARQPGSVFKPIVFLAAFEDAPAGGPVTPATMLQDAPFEWRYDGRVWRPRNYKDTYLGSVPARRALEMSLNSATARLAERVGLERVRAMARAAGIDSELPPYPSMTLGAVEVSPLEIAEVYATIANGGIHIEPKALAKVVTPGGDLIELRSPRVARAASPQAAFLVTHLMEGVIDSGTGRGVRERGLTGPAAGKTGTTNDAHDAWFAGFTPDLVAVVWVGYDRERALGLTGAQAALPIWTDFMKRAAAGRSTRPFHQPPDVVMMEIDPETGMRATARCPQKIREAFRAEQAPQRDCEKHDSWF
jgi:penicillin-binding protein 1B